MIKLDISVARRSTVSRVSRMGRVVGRRASARAMAVAEFLENSPAQKMKSASMAALFRMVDLAKEPESVAGAKSMLGSGGSLERRASGRRTLTSLSGSELRYSAFLMILEKFWLLPPMSWMVPVFCSGMFQRMSSEGLGFLSQ